MSIYDDITKSIIAAIEGGTETFVMPWHRRAGTGSPRNAITGREYNGVNRLLLWAKSERANYQSGLWATYRQWAGAGAQVRKRETSTMVVLYRPIGDATADQDDDQSPRRAIAGAFRVFASEQVDGFTPPVVPVLPEHERIQAAEEFCDNQGATFWHGGDAAFYDPAADMISIPSFESFKTARGYYSTMLHELGHWTGAWNRLDRDLSGRFGSDSYAVEELVAELTAAFLGVHLGLGSEPRRDHAPYVGNWLKVLRSDSRAIFTAASKAQAAADYLISRAAAPSGDEAPASVVPTGQSAQAREIAA